MTALLEVEGLAVRFEGRDSVVRAVQDVSLRLEPGEIVGLVGESGCGKTVTSLALMGLLPRPAGRVTSGSIRFSGQELSAASESEWSKIRGRRISMIFQDPMKCLNPYLRLEEQLGEGPRLHLGMDRRSARARSIEFLGRVGIPDPATRIRDFPHQLSGGMRQRVMIAMALLCEPDLLIADEPTTALDVTIQAQILGLLEELCRERETAILFITHDLAVVSGLCDRVMVMYAGRVVEEAPTREIFGAPQHPYTAALLRCTPRIRGPIPHRLESIEGLPPRLDERVDPGVGVGDEEGRFSACSFAPRCAQVRDACRQGEPPLVETAPGHRKRCILAPDEVT